MPGFRKGKVPPQLVLQRVGRDAVMEQALREGLPEWYERALLDSGSPRSAIRSSTCRDLPAEGEDLEFTIEVAVRPKAKLGEYKGLEVGRAEPEVPAEAIDEEVERLRESWPASSRSSAPPPTGDFLADRLRRRDRRRGLRGRGLQRLPARARLRAR